MVRFSDTLKMTGTALRRNPSVVVYPFFAVLMCSVLQALSMHPSLQSGRLENAFSAVLLISGMCLAATAFTYPIIRLGYTVANELNRPTNVSWNPWIAAFALAIPGIATTILFMLSAGLWAFCLVIPGLLHVWLLWPFFPLVFGPRFDFPTAFSLVKKLVKESPVWVGSLGLVTSIVMLGTYILHVLAIPRLGVALIEMHMGAEIVAVVKVLSSTALAEVTVLTCLHPIIVALMLAEDLHEPIFNAAYEAERRQDDLEELDDYFEESVLPTLAASPDLDAKIESLRDLYDRGIISEDQFNSELEALRSF
jgi:hypothetical protein